MFVVSDKKCHFDHRKKPAGYRNYNFAKISRSVRNDTVFLKYLFMTTAYDLIL